MLTHRFFQLYFMKWRKLNAAQRASSHINLSCLANYKYKIRLYFILKDYLKSRLNYKFYAVSLVWDNSQTKQIQSIFLFFIYEFSRFAKSLLSTGKVLILMLNMSAKSNISFCVKSNNATGYSWKLACPRVSSGIIEIAATETRVAPIERPRRGLLPAQKPKIPYDHMDDGSFAVDG